jgi:hypothetical protein
MLQQLLPMQTSMNRPVSWEVWAFFIHVSHHCTNRIFPSVFGLLLFSIFLEYGFDTIVLSLVGAMTSQVHIVASSGLTSS